MSTGYFTVYWLPRFAGRSIPRLRAWDGAERREFAGVPVEGGLEYNLPDNAKNRMKFKFIENENNVSDWQKEYKPHKGAKLPPKPKEKAVLNKEKASGHPVQVVSRYEIMDILEKNQIKYSVKEKDETLWRKVPDDLKRNLKLDKSKS